MKIVVCIKQVPGTSQVEIDPETGVLKRDGAAAKINPYDLYALETAMRLKERCGGNVTAVTMGPSQADVLGGQLATTRPLVEKGWNDVTKQIVLSGRTVKPKLIITCGVSGAVQFAAGMDGSECIVAINTDAETPIFKIANYCITEDLYSVVPALTAAVQAKQQ